MYASSSGLRSMSSDSPQVRSLLAALAVRMSTSIADISSLQSSDIGTGSGRAGSATVSSQSATTKRRQQLGGQGIADALFGLSGMTTDCAELRAVLQAVSKRIDATRGKLDPQEIGNAL